MIKVNGEKIKFANFPNGETLVDTSLLNNVNDGCRIDFKWEKDADILHLYFVLSHLSSNQVKDKNIYIWYMPYSRMDRSQNGSCFTLSYVAGLLRDAAYNSDMFYILEPHSDVTLQKLGFSKRVNVITLLMEKICQEHNIDIICYPDKGAKDRFQDDKVDKPVIYCEKRRDFDTGQILGLDIITEESVKGKNILILDDLCSRGGTFYHTAKALRMQEANNVYLGVCHMEDSIMDGDIYDNDRIISHIYCLDTMLSNDVVKIINSQRITIFDTEYFLKTNKLQQINQEVAV